MLNKHISSSSSSSSSSSYIHGKFRSRTQIDITQFYVALQNQPFYYGIERLCNSDDENEFEYSVT